MHAHFVGEDFASLDLIDPSVQVQAASQQPGADGRMRPQVFELHKDILLDGRSQEAIAVKVGVIVAQDAAGRLGMR